MIILKSIPLENQIGFLQANTRRRPGPSGLKMMCDGQEPTVIGGTPRLSPSARRQTTIGRARGHSLRTGNLTSAANSRSYLPRR